MKSHLTSILMFVVFLFSSSANSALIDFEDQNMLGDGLLSEGDFVTGLNLFGATFNVVNQGMIGGSLRELMIFDSSCSGASCSGNDPDLSTAGSINADNILIISEDNDQSDPDDYAQGGTFIITFDNDITSFTGTTVDIGDSDSGPNFFEAFLDGSLVATANLAIFQGDNNIQSRTLTGLFDEVRLTIAGSGALASIEFTPVPIPAALPLLLTGLMGLFVFRNKSSVE